MAPANRLKGYSFQEPLKSGVLIVNLLRFPLWNALFISLKQIHTETAYIISKIDVKCVCVWRIGNIKNI